jgi:hypothetical protein
MPVVSSFPSRKEQPRASVSQLGYLGIGVRDAKAWQDLATNILGLRVIPGDDKSTSYLRMDEYHHRLELRSNGSDDLEFVGWQVPDPATLQRVVQQLEDGGVKVNPGTYRKRRAPEARRWPPAPHQFVPLLGCVEIPPSAAHSSGGCISSTTLVGLPRRMRP